MSFTVAAIVGGALLVGGATVLGIEAGNQKTKSRIEEARRRRLEKQYKQLQQSRQEVIDQSDEIRGLKDQVFNPYANIGVAMQATNMKLEQSDEDLANILQSVNQAGGGGGAATQLAKMAASSKAQVMAGLEQQEVQNQQLRLQGEAQVMQQKLNFEQMALQEEVAAWGRQETRDIADMGRVERLEGRAEQRSLMHEQQRAQAINQIGSQMMSTGGSMFSSGMGGQVGGVSNPGSSNMFTAPTNPGITSGNQNLNWGQQVYGPNPNQSQSSNLNWP